MNFEMRESVVEYLLGELSPEEAERFEADLLLDAGLRAELDRLRPVVNRLEEHPAAAWEPIEPPPLDIAAIVAADGAARDRETAAAVKADVVEDESTGTIPSTASEPSLHSASPRRPRRSFAERFGFGFPSLAAAAFSALLILAVGIGLGTQLGGDDSSTGQPVQALALDTIGNEVPEGASGEVLLTGDAGDPVTLDVSGLEQTGEREFYELWLLGEEGELVSLGSFRVQPDGNSQVEVPLPVNPENYRYFDVSIEPENGSPDHSGRSVLRGLTPS